PEQDFSLYKDVVNGCYRFHDMLLGRLLELAGEDTTVLLCSDHGYYSDNLRPLLTPQESGGMAVWHRPFGIFTLTGPNVRKDEWIFGPPTLLDIVPTVLTLRSEERRVGKDDGYWWRQYYWQKRTDIV